MSTRDLRRCGLSRDAIASRVQRGWLHPIHRGVYAVGYARLIAEGQFMAAVKACGAGTVLSHFAGSAHWAVVKWDNRYPEVTVPGKGTRRHKGIRIHQSSAIEATIHKGIPVTTPARTLVDLASVLPYKPLRRAVRQAFALSS